MYHLCLACVVASPDSFLDHALGIFGAGMLFTDEACCCITGTFCVTAFIIHHFTSLGTQSTIIMQGKIITSSYNRLKRVSGNFMVIPLDMKIQI